MKALHAYFSGRVQSVGFRYTAYDIAQNLNLTGFVCNLPDGRVELLAQGDVKNLEKLLAELKQNFPDAVTEIFWSQKTKNYHQFKIEY